MNDRLLIVADFTFSNGYLLPTLSDSFPLLEDQVLAPGVSISRKQEP